MNGRRNVGRVLGHAAVVMVILAVIAAAFAISYDPVRDIARTAGVQSWLVRIYPGVLDAVFLVACACALLLRQARWWNRLYAWLSVLVTGALIGAADVSHATGLRLPRRTMDGTVWALPWALVLLGFSLWLTTLQRSKPSDPGSGETPAADAPVRVLEGTPATRAALPAPGRTGGLSEVGFGTQAAKTAANADQAPADMEKGAEDVEPPVAAEAGESAEPVAETAPESPEPAESTAPVAPAEPAEAAAAPAASDVAEAEDTPQATSVPEAGEAAQAGDAAPAADPIPAQDDETVPSIPAPAATESAEVAGVPQPEEAAGTGQAGEVAGAAQSGDVAGAGPAEEPEWPFEPEEPAGTRTADAARPVSISDDDTPPYGFPAVTEHDEAPRMPTLLSAPVPADMETAPAGEEDRGAKGRPPAAAPDLPATEAELSHEPAPFERVRSTPTPPKT
ncbi:MAG TPA: DUF2637 domain-containing protein [Streptosporangiaceae bacterium]|nr:DUF2637 domain-containing protein [Streptosporangiaceae bacterium]